MSFNGENLSFDIIETWKVDSLKVFLKKRGLSTVGTKKELVARVFVASEQKLPLVPTKEEVDREKRQEYKSLLMTEDGYLPDPMLLKPNEWTGEKDGMTMWPPIMYWDIANFLKLTGQPDELSNRLMGDYKEGKAYSYYTSDWLQEIFYHPIQNISTYCFLAAFCKPSQHLNSEPHKVWICAEKKSGAVRSAYCTCFAGFGQTCNHVAAVLFKIDAAWKLGLTNPSCTSVESNWDKPKSKFAIIQPIRVKDMKIKKPHFRKQGEPDVHINPSERQLFNPTASSANLSDTLQYFTSVLPQAVVSIQFQDPAPEEQKTCKITASDMETLSLSSKSLPEFLGKIRDLKHVIEQIEKLTCNQSLSQEWKKQRKGRITSSNFHRVVSNVNMMDHGKPVSKSLLAEIIGEKESSNCIPAIKWGHEKEAVAKRNYLRQLRRDGHRNVISRETGILLDADEPFLGASPDLLLQCDCCGVGALEVKCPWSVRFSDPKVVRPSYVDDGGLKRNHAYYMQIQGVMAISGRKWCDFYVYTTKGHYQERVPFDLEFWEGVKPKLVHFFTKHVAPRLLCNATVCSEKKALPCLPKPSDISKNPMVHNLNAKATGVSRTRKGEKCIKKLHNDVICGLCDSVCKEPKDIVTDDDNSICCDYCKKWFHWKCLHITHKSKEVELDKWYCERCLVKT